MAVNSPLFLAFFLWVFVLFHFFTWTRRHRLLVIVAASLAFYASAGSPWFLVLLLGSCAANYGLAHRVAAAPAERKGRVLALGVTLNLIPLAVFKYTGFAFENANKLLEVAHAGTPLDIPKLALPLGISFYTFKAISYLVDVRRGIARPSRRPLVFLAGFVFFPSMTAGPITRAQELLPQLERLAPPSWDSYRWGLVLVAAGLVNKSIADMLARNADPVFAAKGHQSALEAWSAAIAFTGQIYADFAGYTDIVTGVALFLGVALPPNFDLPYLARSPVEFWQRWHISLSTWLRDYLWLPLSLRFPRRAVLNLLATMVLCGVWHGASWPFVAWGLWNGVIIVGAHALGARFPLPERARRSPAVVTGQVLFTLYLVLIGRVIQRAPTLAGAGTLLADMHWPQAPSPLTPEVGIALGLSALGLVLSHAVSAITRARERLLGAALFWPVAAALWAVAMVIGGSTTTFRYANF